MVNGDIHLLGIRSGYLVGNSGCGSLMLLLVLNLGLLVRRIMNNGGTGNCNCMT